MVKKPHGLRWGLLIAIGVTMFCLIGPDMFTTVTGWFNKGTDEIPVLVADHFIAPFQVLKSEDIKVRMFPRDFVPPGVLHASSEILKDDGQFLYSSMVGIPEGQPLTRMILNETGKDHGLSSFLRPGKVAVSFKVERDKSAGGWVKPGDTIAIFQTLPLDLAGHGGRRQTRLLLNAVEVLSVDQAHLGHEVSTENKPEAIENGPVENETSILTVLTNTAEASSLIEAQQAGPLMIVLRPLGDEIPWLSNKGTPE